LRRPAPNLDHALRYAGPANWFAHLKNLAGLPRGMRHWWQEEL
jgi:hypothetical protein